MTRRKQTPMEIAEQFAAEYSSTLRVGETGTFDTAVSVNMRDGSSFFWDAAFYEVRTVGDTGTKWLMVFPEHYRPQVFHPEEVLQVCAWKRVG